MKKLLSILMLLVTIVIGAKAGDVNVTPVINQNYANHSCGLVTWSIDTSKGKIASSAIQASANGNAVDITFTTTKSDFYIKTITFGNLINGSLAVKEGSSGSIDGTTFTGVANQTTVTITLNSESGRKGTVKIPSITINVGDYNVQALSDFNLSNGTITASKINGEEGTPSFTMTTDGGSTSSGLLNISNSRKITFDNGTSKITYIAFNNTEDKMGNDGDTKYTASTGTYSGGAWNGNATSVDITNGSGGGRKFDVIYVIAEAAGPSLSVTPPTANAFTYVAGDGPSEAQEFTVSLANSDKAVSATLNSENYEMSKTSDGTYASTAITDLVNGDKVYVRLKEGLAKGTGYNGTLTFANADVEDDVVINLSGSVTVLKCATPTIAVGDFNFENKGYKVTITNNEAGSTLKVSTDGSSYTTQTSPYETYATATTHYYAKAEKTSYEDSDVADENVENTFDGEKKFVAWVYTSDYSTGSGKPNYAFATDPMVIALQTVYNVVPVDYAQTVTPSADLKKADLIVCTEAMTGDKTMSNGMVALLDGTAPMIGLKMFNYGAGDNATKRWKWGLPANPSSTVYGFTAKNANYKVLDGITFESDGTIKLATGRFSDNNKNVVQTANFTGAEKPADNVILGTLDDDDTKAVMHYSATKKYFGLGLSSDCWSYYTANATTIVKNAAAMLIAGEDLTATVENIEIDASGVATYVTKNALDFTGLETKAYVVTGTNSAKTKVLTQEVTTVPAGTALLVKGATVNVPVIANATAPATNLFQVSNGSVVQNAQNSIFVYSKAAKAFKRLGTATIPSGKCYITIVGVTTQSLDVDIEGEATAITNVIANENANSAAPVKIIKNGKLYIGNYNVAGQQVK